MSEMWYRCSDWLKVWLPPDTRVSPGDGKAVVLSSLATSQTTQEGTTQSSARLLRSISRANNIMAEHDKPPEYVEVPPEIRQKFDQLEDSPYWRSLQPLKALVVGRTILSSEAGHSGFTLFLSR